MSKPKLIILESADNLGKTTLVKLLASKINATILQQPSANNTLSFIREIVKGNTPITPFARQLLHAISHTVDLYETMLNSRSNIVMDRCYISALIYGRLSGLTEYELSLLYNIHRKLYSKLEDFFDVTICILTRSKPFANKDDSIYERTIEWNDVNLGYCAIVENQLNNKQVFFAESESVILIDRDILLSDDEICDYIIRSASMR